MKFSVACLVSSLVFAGVAGAEELTLERLMLRMAASPGVVADFHETKSLALLQVPIESRGRIYFVPPNRLRRQMTSPGTSTLLIDGAHLQLHNEAGGEHLDLSKSPMVRHFVDHFIVLFNGDLEALRRAYEVDFEIDGHDWTLTLHPRRAPVTSIIRTVRIDGDGASMRHMVIVEPDGDHTTTTFDQVDVAHRFTAEELDELFPPREITAP